MQDVLGSLLERSEEGKPRKAESKVPLMVVGSKSQRSLFSGASKKAGDVDKALCALPCTLESRNSSTCLRGCTHHLCLLLPGNTPQNWNKSCWPKFLRDMEPPKRLQGQKAACSPAGCSWSLTILWIGAKPMMLDRRDVPHAGPPAFFLSQQKILPVISRCNSTIFKYPDEWNVSHVVLKIWKAYLKWKVKQYYRTWQDVMSAGLFLPRSRSHVKRDICTLHSQGSFYICWRETDVSLFHPHSWDTKQISRGRDRNLNNLCCTCTQWHPLGLQ